VERRAPDLATSAWWKEERHGVFVDYNQNAKDRTVASVYSVRPTADARVSMPLLWGDLPACDPRDFTLVSVPPLFAERGDPGAGIDQVSYSLESLLELSARQEASGLGDAPWPPMYAKTANEPPRAPPSKRRAAPATAEGGGAKVRKSKAAASEGSQPEPATETAEAAKKGQRVPKFPLIVVSKAAKKPEAFAGLERWKARHPEAAAYLAEDDVLVDAMRGKSATWTRIRLNLRHVPDGLRPAPETPDPDYDPWEGLSETWLKRQKE
jgi:hypothetical protein